jgi:hypothetical protein
LEAGSVFVSETIQVVDLVAINQSSESVNYFDQIPAVKYQSH